MMDCIFCTIQKERIVLENEYAYAIYDGFPVNPGHFLIIPKRHFSDYFESSDTERLALLKLVDEAKKILDKEKHPAGYNIGINIGEAAGQSVMHLHIHLIPRYTGDVKNPRGGVRGVIPGKQSY
jgi:diadenosine tetraphosphate (Ap4A) HIT family hydrolase